MTHKTMTEVAHETVKGLHKIGLVDQTTMHAFDALCLPKIKELGPKEIKKIRAREKVSQPVLAMYLNVSPYTVKHWEQGTKHPTGSALKLLNLILEKGLIAIA
jgi:putative transcriptional regulator